jgi:uncharacterized protein with von Willebrand factor type A (vWA) domain
MKPPCKFCESRSEETLSSILGNELLEKLVYKLFNPNADLGLAEQDPSIIEKLIRSFLNKIDDKDLEDEFDAKFLGWIKSHGEKWFKDYVKHRKAKQFAWEALLEKIRSGEIDPSKLSVDQLLQHFLHQIMDGLNKEGIVNIKLQRDFFHGNVFIAYPEFTEKSEKIIAKKVLEEVSLNLKDYRRAGSHETEELGWGIRPSYMLWDYDEQQHSYDMIDIQETLIKTARRDPVRMRISNEDLKVRIPYHETSTVNVILIDTSYSMRGDKFRGGIMAALAFKELIEQEYKDDKLHIVAYNHRPKRLSRGEVIKLKPYGYTDIGQALDFAVKLLSKEEGNKNVFLITDGEPTATHLRNQTPEESALRAAYVAGKADIYLNIIMLDKRPELRYICEQMAKLNSKATVTYVDNPLNLKEFVIRFFINRKSSLANPKRLG